MDDPKSLEALEILGRYAEGKNPSASLDAKFAAAAKLLKRVEGLDNQMPGLTAERDGDTVAVTFGFGTVLVQYNRHQGKFAVREADGNKWREVPLVFNRARANFEGSAVDSTTVPVPGEPKEKRRDALAVIAEVIVDAIEKSP
jgi:hypothetical protein